MNIKFPRLSKLNLIKLLLWASVFYSAIGLTYYTRWFIPYLTNGYVHILPNNQIPLLGFIVQICSNLIFLYVGFSLIRLFNKYKQTGFFDKQSLVVFNGVILCCLGLALLGAAESLFNNFNEVHIDEWTGLESSVNLLFRSFTRLFVFREPQTMYLLLAIILWAVKQFVTKALYVKTENESFI